MCMRDSDKCTFLIRHHEPSFLAEDVAGQAVKQERFMAKKSEMDQ